MAVEHVHEDADPGQGMIRHSQFGGRHSFLDQRDHPVRRADQQPLAGGRGALGIAKEIVAPDRQPQADPAQGIPNHEQHDRDDRKDRHELAPLGVHRFDESVEHGHGLGRPSRCWGLPYNLARHGAMRLTGVVQICEAPVMRHEDSVPFRNTKAGCAVDGQAGPSTRAAATAAEMGMSPWISTKRN